MAHSVLLARILLGMLAVLLVVAAIGDLRHRLIANRLNLAIALLAVPWWLTIGLSPWGVAGQFAVALALLALFAGCFALGWMGGGDVKLLAALGLWLPVAQVAQLLIWMAIGGALLAVVMLVRRRTPDAAIEVPYGVAIAGAALLVMSNDILTTLRP